MTETTCPADGCDARLRSGWCKKHREQDPRVKAYRKAYRAKNRDRLNAARKAHREANAEHVAEYNRRYYAENKTANAERCRAWREANPERHAANSRRWTDANPEKARAQWQRKNARRYAQIVATRIGPVDYAAVIERHGMWCHLCGHDIATLNDLHLDHVIPLALGGPHTEDNLRPAHARCNQKKGAQILASSHRRTVAAEAS